MLVPYMVNGRLRVTDVAWDASGREMAWFAEDEVRKAEVLRCRDYYEGRQWDAANEAVAQTLGVDLTRERLPEHHRLHAYSVHIQESVDFIADMLTSGYFMVADDTEVQEVLDRAMDATEALTGGDDDEELNVEPLVRDALIAGDQPYEVRWDPFEETCWLEFWDAEQVTFVNPSGMYVSRVVRTEVIWVTDEAGQDVQVRERVEYEVMVNGEHGHDECRRAVFYDDDDAPRETSWLGVPFIPWGLLRGHRKSVRQLRGESMVTTRAMDAADRFDANEQTAYLIARYNSHGNLVVVGDAAAIELRTEGAVQKDVADVLTFPGGTSATAIALPTDPRMIEHQRATLSDALYQCFGLVRVEPDTMRGLGSVSGYALEILNRKTEGTFRRIRRQWKKDWRTLCSMILDVTAFKRGATLEEEAAMLTDQGITATVSPPEWWDIEPLVAFPNRGIDIRMGTGYVVEEVSVRDDFTANLYSRREALRQRGKTEQEIDDIEAELAEEQPNETGRFSGTEAPAVGTQAARISTGRA